MRALQSQILLISLVLAVGLLAGCKERATAPRAEPKPPTVVVATVQTRDVPVTYEFIGQTDATRRVEIRARVPGFVIAREYSEGGSIREGDILYRLDPKPFEADLEVARAEMDQARAEQKSAESDVARFTELLAADAGSQKELDDAVARRTGAVARIRAAEARIARGELELGYTVIRSPLSGVAGESQRAVGSYVDAGTESLLTEVIETDPIDVLFTVSEREVLRSQEAIRDRRLFLPPDGKITLELTLLDGSRYPHTGLLSFADIRVDPKTGTTRVRGEFPNPENALRPGQFVRGRLTGYLRANAITAPRSCVLQSPSGAFVYVITADGTVDSRPVALGEWVGSDVIVTSGLSAGDRLVVEGTQRVGPGVKATVVAAGTDPSKGR